MEMGTSWSWIEARSPPPSLFFFFQAEDGIRDTSVTGVQTCALPIFVGVAVPAPGGDLLGQLFGPEPGAVSLRRARERLRRCLGVTDQRQVNRSVAPDGAGLDVDLYHRRS